MKKYLIGLLMVLSLSTHSAEFFTGNDLLDKMKTSRSLALGYIAGVADENDGSFYMNFPTIPSFVEQHANCIPAGVTMGQTIDVVEQYLIANPAVRHSSGALLVKNALRSAWPCKKKIN